MCWCMCVGMNESMVGADCLTFDGPLFSNRYPFVEFFFHFEACMFNWPLLKSPD